MGFLPLTLTEMTDFRFEISSENFSVGSLPNILGISARSTDRFLRTKIVRRVFSLCLTAVLQSTTEYVRMYHCDNMCHEQTPHTQYAHTHNICKTPSSIPVQQAEQQQRRKELLLLVLLLCLCCCSSSCCCLCMCRLSVCLSYPSHSMFISNKTNGSSSSSSRVY